MAQNISPEVKKWLYAAGLDKYEDVFSSHGLTTVNDIIELSPEDIRWFSEA